MLFDFNKHSAKLAARERAPQRLEERQRDVYESHRHRVFSLSYYMSGSEMEAEDLLRDTFVTAFQQAEEPDQTMVDTALVDQLSDHMLLEETEFVPVPTSIEFPARRNIMRPSAGRRATAARVDIGDLQHRVSCVGDDIGVVNLFT